MFSVKSGIKRGRGEAGSVYGAPTINLSKPVHGMTGVFAGELILDNQTIPVAICLGAEEGKCEFHALTNQPPQIDGEVILILQKQVSDLEPWQSIEQMRAKIHADIEKVRNYFDAI